MPDPAQALRHHDGAEPLGQHEPVVAGSAGRSLGHRRAGGAGKREQSKRETRGVSMATGHVRYPFITTAEGPVS